MVPWSPFLSFHFTLFLSSLSYTSFHPSLLISQSHFSDSFTFHFLPFRSRFSFFHPYLFLLTLINSKIIMYGSYMYCSVVNTRDITARNIFFVAPCKVQYCTCVTKMHVLYTAASWKAYFLLFYRKPFSGFPLKR